MPKPVFLFTDFGSADIYVGQVKAVFLQHIPGITVTDLLNDAPAANVRAGAHLLAALIRQVPVDSVTMAVVDPGVGGARDAVVVRADGRWLVGPDNGLLSILAARAQVCEYWRLVWRPHRMSASFHGRDLFAPIAAELTRGQLPADKTEPITGLGVSLGAGDLCEIIYIDHYGNACTGLRAQVAPAATITVSGLSLAQARTFSDVPPDSLFWYENSLGLVEIAGNLCSAAGRLGLSIGQAIEIAAG